MVQSLVRAHARGSRVARGRDHGYFRVRARRGCRRAGCYDVPRSTGCAAGGDSGEPTAGGDPAGSADRRDLVIADRERTSRWQGSALPITECCGGRGSDTKDLPRASYVFTAVSGDGGRSSGTQGWASTCAATETGMLKGC